MGVSTVEAADSETCPRCFGRVTSTDTEHYCEECGLVVEESPVDRGPDWRSFADSERNPERAAPGNPNHADRGMGSTRHTQDATNRAGRRQDMLHRHARTGSKTERNRGYATTEIHRMTNALELPEYVGERAKLLFRKAHAEGINGKDLDTVAAACLYAACRRDGMGYTAGDIEEVARTEARPIRRRLYAVANLVDVEIPPPDVAQRLRVVAGRLTPTDREAIRAALTALEEMDDAEIHRGSPSVLVGLLLWQNGPWTQADVGEAAGVTPTAMRNRR